eukprot:gb/GECH01011088.1/.p1 GENE.gb/GECH01011088.1/~~gb/GECH01011088.1/.p1  ORF type:complete len:192 (+),score=25.56 gb/GECH01011088.1/:1-576(+)
MFTLVEGNDGISGESRTERLKARISQSWQHFLDKINPLFYFRWIFSVVLIIAYFLRIYLVGGYYIVTYGLGIYILNLLIGFLSPQADPAEFDPDLDDEEDYSLPTLQNQGDEFKPFVRKLPEFKFWLGLTKALVIGLTMTCISVFDIPAYWPILLVYFIVLFIATMRRQIRHMLKYKYVPFNVGKTKYSSK